MPVVALLGVGTATATHDSWGLLGHTTVEWTVKPVGPDTEYNELGTGGPGEPYLVRDGGAEGNGAIPQAQAGRDARRVSLAYLSQMTDFQLADEESPARVEFADPGPASAWRPQEGLTAFQVEATIRQINAFADESPVAQGDGSRAAMDFGLLTGDQADNQQLNETRWVRDLLEGNGPLNFNSGLTDAASYGNQTSPSCQALLLQQGGAEGAATEAAGYTGVQDYDDYPVAPPLTPLYYDPDDPTGPTWDEWPQYGGLLDRAQQIELQPEGLAVPFYITNGNHDVLVQGNEDANAAFEDIALGCFKPLATVNDPTTPPEGLDGPDPTALLSPANVGMLVPPDPDRQFVSKPQIKALYGATDEGEGDDDHGFAYVDPAENEASNGSASYYAWDPEQTPGFRFVSIDTNSEGGQTAEGVAAGSSDGNLDDPQFQWIKRELQAAKERNQLVVVFGHHPVRSMDTEIRDEQAAPCTGTDDGHGHDINPGCDLDPRLSFDANGCIHNGEDSQNTTCSDAQHESFVDLLDQFPNVVAYIPGHTHEHRLTPFVRTDGSTWWEINTSAVIDYPNQSRLVEIMDNRDGTLSIFNTVVDHAAAVATPPECPDGQEGAEDCAAEFDAEDLASIGRTFTYNDPDNDGSGDGRAIDRNAELLLEDPRPEANLSLAITDEPDPVEAGKALEYLFTVANAGPGESQDTTLTATLPAEVEIGDVTASQGTCERDGVSLRCELGAVAAGANATVTVELTPAAAGELTVSGQVRGNVQDADTGNDSDTETTTVGAAASPTPTTTATPTPTPTPNTTPTPTPTPTPGPGGTSCTPARAFTAAELQPRGGALRFAFGRSAGAGLARIDVSRVTLGRRVTSAEGVTRFSGRAASFRWRARGVRDGIYVVRFAATDAQGRRDVRRHAAIRRGGRWKTLARFARRPGCSPIRNFSLARPAFGGSNRLRLIARVTLNRAARARVDVLRGERLVKRFPARQLEPGVRRRVRWRAARSAPRGSYRVRVTVVDGATRLRSLLRARKR